MATRQFSIVLSKVVGGAKQPDTGRTVQLKDLGGNLIATATETPASSGKYVASVDGTLYDRWGYWYVDGTAVPEYNNNSPFWLGNYDHVSASYFEGHTGYINHIIAEEVQGIDSQGGEPLYIHGGGGDSTGGDVSIYGGGDRFMDEVDRGAVMLGVSGTLRSAGVAVGKVVELGAGKYLDVSGSTYISGNLDVRDTITIRAASGSYTHTGVVTISGGLAVTGTLSATSSWAVSASRAVSALSSSYALSSSWALSAAYAPGASGTPGGADKQLQYNDGGAFAGAGEVNWDKTAKALTVSATMLVSGSLHVSSTLSIGNNAADAARLYFFSTGGAVGGTGWAIHNYGGSMRIFKGEGSALAMAISGSTGGTYDQKVCINRNTTSPNATLDVGGDCIISGSAIISGTYNESGTSHGVYIGSISGTPRAGFFNGTAAQNWQIDNASGVFRWYLPGVEHFLLSSTHARFLSKTVEVSGALWVSGSTASHSIAGVSFVGNMGLAGNAIRLTGSLHVSASAINLSGVMAMQTNVWHTDLAGVKRVYYMLASGTYWENSIGRYTWRSGNDLIDLMVLSQSGGTATLTVTGGITLSGSAVGNFKCQGPGAGYEFTDRSSGQNWQWYATGAVTRLFNGTGDTFHVSSSGNWGATSKCTIYSGSATQGMGLPPIIYASHIGSRRSSVAYTNMGGAAQAGLYRYSYYMRCSVVDGGATAVQASASWNDGGVALTRAGAAMNLTSTSNYQEGTWLMYHDHATTQMQFAFRVTVGGELDEYVARVSLERLTA